MSGLLRNRKITLGFAFRSSLVDFEDKSWKQGRSRSQASRSLEISGGRKNGAFFFFNKCIYLFMAALGLRCCARAFSGCGERGLLFIAVASLVAEHGL